MPGSFSADRIFPFCPFPRSFVRHNSIRTSGQLCPSCAGEKFAKAEIIKRSKVERLKGFQFRDSNFKEALLTDG